MGIFLVGGGYPSEVGYTSAKTQRGDHESSYEHVVALGKNIYISLYDRRET
jgi:hypothetical protein